jgi:hypothetical protein
MRSSRTDAGSSDGSCGTSSPRNARSSTARRSDAERRCARSIAVRSASRDDLTLLVQRGYRDEQLEVLGCLEVPDVGRRRLVGRRTPIEVATLQPSEKEAVIDG